MTDFPEMAIAADSVDSEMLDRPRRWNIKFIRNFMLFFGSLSSVFDYLTFGSLLFLLNATTDQFRTGWFLESVISASLIVLVIRSRVPFYKSKPGKLLFIATQLVVGATLVLPFTLFGKLFGFTRVPISFLLMLAAIVVLYIISAEALKRSFYKKVNF